MFNPFADSYVKRFELVGDTEGFTLVDGVLARYEAILNERT